MPSERMGQLSILLACVFFAAAAVSAKYLAAGYSGLFVSLVRFGLGAVFCVLALAWLRREWRVQGWRVWAIRGILGSLAMSLTYWAIQLTSSGRAILLADTYPIFVAIFGYLFFREAITRRHVGGLIVGMLGVLLVFYDRSQYGWLGNLLAFGAGVVGGVSVHYVKLARSRNNPFLVYLSACLFGLIWCLVSAGEVRHLNGQGAFALVLVAVFGFVGQVLAGYGFKYVSATTGGIAGLAEVPLTVAFSALLGEEMRPRFWLGTVLIVAGILINYYPGRRARGDREPA
ncbi:MAG: DMT family transporter [candidate division FCPU426 bacterium]